MRTLWLTLALLLCLAAATNVFADAIQDSANPLQIPDNNGRWAANYLVWSYTAAKSYTLTDVESKFGPGGKSATLGVAIYNGFGWPSGGFPTGPTGLLGSSTMLAMNNDNWSTAVFAPVKITAGHTYGIEFSGTSGVSHNATADPFPFPITITPSYYGFNGSSWFYLGQGDFYFGIFQFSGTPINTVTPEPGSLLMLGSGLLATVGAIRRKLR
jgi:hypothetical protein